MALRRFPPRSLSGLLLLLSVMVAGCAPPPPATPLEVEYAGCKAVLEPGPVCVLPENREIWIWAGAPPDARITIQIDGEPADAAGETVREGRRFSLVLPAGAREVNVRAAAQGEPVNWSLALAASSKKKAQPSELRRSLSRDLIQEVAETARPLYNFIQDRQFIRARKMLNGLRTTPKMPAEFRYHVAFFKGLLAEKEGDYRSALTEIQRAVEIAERVKPDRFQWLAEEKLGLLLCGVGRCRESAEIFERLKRTPLAADPCEGGQLLINQGWDVLLAREAGEDFADPTPLLESALATYSACAYAEVGQKANLLVNLALAHLQEDRVPQARAALARARKLEPHPPLLQTLWRLDVEARLALRENRPLEALRRFEGLAGLAAETSSSDGRLRAAFGQAQSYRALADPARALEILRQAEALLDAQSMQIPVHEGRETFVAARQAIVSLHIELLLDQGRPAEALAAARHARSRVLQQLAHADRLASLAADRRARWESFLMEYQKRRAALEERAKDDWKVPTDQIGAERAARRREAEAVQKLLDRAFLVLGTPGEQPQRASSRPRPGELILAYQPLSQPWVVGFAAAGDTVTAYRFELPPGVLSRPQELGRLLLLPFREPIRRAHRIRILASGSLQGTDFHALPLDGEILLARVPVVYGLDLPVSAATTPSPGRRSLLVADPRNDLPGARDEVRAVRKVLASGPRPWITEELKSTEASADAVRRGLATADLLHYAGHGAFSGFGGWESSLLLADDTRLTLGDLLALERVPSRVVLSGCETGRSSTETSVESLGLAHAFLLAGSQEVVASTRRTDDRTVPAFFTDLYRRWDREPDLATALQRAQLAWRGQNPRADWASFRLFVP